PHKKSPVQGGVSPAEGRGHAAPAGAKSSQKHNLTQQGAEPPPQKYGLKKAADKKIKQTEVKFLNQA
ncbi:hypothetical protein, partial [Ruminococcus bicirculans (ex Wegman et al. 2014)]|uniref:hypothetical protein n=1 Tax=Ruminococcus bicirculans (ex Wegman et al. 2014) TaxID=1160721 RepID=UPI003A91E4BA